MEEEGGALTSCPSPAPPSHQWPQRHLRAEIQKEIQKSSAAPPSRNSSLGVREDVQHLRTQGQGQGNPTQQAGAWGQGGKDFFEEDVGIPGWRAGVEAGSTEHGQHEDGHQAQESSWGSGQLGGGLLGALHRWTEAVEVAQETSQGRKSGRPPAAEVPCGGTWQGEAWRHPGVRPPSHTAMEQGRWEREGVDMARTEGEREGRLRGTGDSAGGRTQGPLPPAERSQGREEDRGRCCQGNCSDREREMIKGKDGRASEAEAEVGSSPGGRGVWSQC